MWKLLDGKELNATELAIIANTSPQKISMHLTKFVQVDLLCVESQGRQRHIKCSEKEIAYAIEAMTPGGHWMGITGAVCQTQKADFAKTIFTYTAVSFGIFDGFITCWNTKFHWSLLRPETYINKYMDVNWLPYLQTPPFPEYTSGHSVISSAAATILTNIYGENVPFKDSTEMAWGWPDRTYKSPKEAAVEASVSRLYGGIHYREALEVGLSEGKEVGEYVLTKLKMSKKQKNILLSPFSN